MPLPLLPIIMLSARKFLISQGTTLIGVVILLGACWYGVHRWSSLQETLLKAQQDVVEQKELHESTEALLKMRLHGQEVARLVAVRNAGVAHETAVDMINQDKLLTKRILQQSRRIDELLDQQESSKQWGDTVHPVVATKCLQSLAGASASAARDSGSSPRSDCDLAPEGVVSPD